MSQLDAPRLSIPILGSSRTLDAPLETSTALEPAPELGEQQPSWGLNSVGDSGLQGPHSSLAEQHSGSLRHIPNDSVMVLETTSVGSSTRRSSRDSSGAGIHSDPPIVSTSQPASLMSSGSRVPFIHEPSQVTALVEHAHMSVDFEGPSDDRGMSVRRPFARLPLERPPSATGSVGSTSCDFSGRLGPRHTTTELSSLPLTLTEIRRATTDSTTLDLLQQSGRVLPLVTDSTRAPSRKGGSSASSLVDLGFGGIDAGSQSHRLDSLPVSVDGPVYEVDLLSGDPTIAVMPLDEAPCSDTVASEEALAFQDEVPLQEAGVLLDIRKVRPGVQVMPTDCREILVSTHSTRLAAMGDVVAGGDDEGSDGLLQALSAFGAPNEWWHDSIILGRLSALALRYFAAKASKRPWDAWKAYIRKNHTKGLYGLRQRRYVALRSWRYRLLVRGRYRNKLPLIMAVQRLPTLVLRPTWAKLQQAVFMQRDLARRLSLLYLIEFKMLQMLARAHHYQRLLRLGFAGLWLVTQLPSHESPTARSTHSQSQFPMTVPARGHVQQVLLRVWRRWSFATQMWLSSQEYQARETEAWLAGECRTPRSIRTNTAFHCQVSPERSSPSPTTFGTAHNASGIHSRPDSPCDASAGLMLPFPSAPLDLEGSHAGSGGFVVLSTQTLADDKEPHSAPKSVRRPRARRDSEIAVAPQRQRRSHLVNSFVPPSRPRRRSSDRGIVHSYGGTPDKGSLTGVDDLERFDEDRLESDQSRRPSHRMSVTDLDFVESAAAEFDGPSNAPVNYQGGDDIGDYWAQRARVAPSSSAVARPVSLRRRA